MTITAANTAARYESLVPNGAQSLPEHRWIGRCHCGKVSRIEGRVVLGVVVWATGSRRDLVVEATGKLAGLVYTTSYMGSDPTSVHVRCGDHWVRLARVTEGTKASKHACGARCTGATGPNCDCRCRGANHGSGR